jgi:restriction system protein
MNCSESVFLKGKIVSKVHGARAFSRWRQIGWQQSTTFLPVLCLTISFYLNNKKMEKENNAWMVRAGQAGHLIDDFIDEDVVAIGWNELGKLSPETTYEQLKQKFKETYPENSEERVNQCVGQLWRFLNQMKTGDKVVSYDSAGRGYFLGTITSDYQYDSSEEFCHRRKANWVAGPTDRDTLSPEARNALGATSAIFEVSKQTWDELTSNHPGYISGEDIQSLEERQRKIGEQNLRDLKEDIISKSKEFIKDIISNLSWQDTEQLVAGLLNSMGYRTRLTSRGSDIGSDIVASPDDLGLEEPRIRIEVKKRSRDKIGQDEIKTFIGGMGGYHKGIYVTTSGFTKEAFYEAERANLAITLVDSNWLVDLLLSNYEELDAESKALVPLRKIYWPA